MLTFAPNPIRPIQDGRRAVRAWLRLPVARQQATPCPRVYANNERQLRAVRNIARQHNLSVPL